MSSIQRVNKRCSALQMVAVFPCFMVAGWGVGKCPWPSLWLDRRSLMSIYMNTFNIHHGVWGTSPGPWVEGHLLCCRVSAAALLRHASALVERLRLRPLTQVRSA